MKKKAAPEKKATPVIASDSSNRLMYIVLLVIALLIIVAIVISSRSDNADATAWATVRSNELHSFFSDCRSGGGSVDVRPNSAPQIIFACIFSDRTVEYTLQPGK